MKIFVIGGASFDDIIHVEEFMESVPHTVFAKSAYSTPGSSGFSKAIALKRLGFEVSFFAVVGADQYGQQITSTLRKEGVKFLSVIDHSGTERHTNIMNKFGERISIIMNSTSDNTDFDAKAYEEEIIKADFICLNINNYGRKFIPLIKKHKKPVWVDIHDYNGFDQYYDEFIDIADFIFMSSDKIADPEEYLKRWVNTGKILAICTKGKDGAIYFGSEKELLSVEGSSLKVVDTNGAGDNFFSGFVYGYYHGKNALESLEMGRIVADSCVLSKKIVSDDLSLEILRKKH